MNNDVVIINLDRPRQLKFNHTALKTLVELTGKSLEDIDGDLTTPSNFELIERLAYCGLLKDAKDHNEIITPEMVPDLLDEAPVYSHVLEKIFAAWGAAFGAGSKTEGNQLPADLPAKGNVSTGTKASE